MSPFSQLQSALTNHYGYGNGIDRDFSPILNYIDEFDRHFSRRHKFINCFIPRFDLEEDERNYYLYGDVPGATEGMITVEVNDDHTLVVYGRTERPGPERGGVVMQEQEAGEKTQVQQEGQTFAPPPTEPPPTHHHQRQLSITSPFTTSHSNTNPNPNQNANPNAFPNIAANGHLILLSERLVGEFTRTFAFPSVVDEKGIKASMENGVLSLVVPKKEAVEEKKRGVKIPVLKGGWWKSENGVRGESGTRVKDGGKE